MFFFYSWYRGCLQKYTKAHLTYLANMKTTKIKFQNITLSFLLMAFLWKLSQHFKSAFRVSPVPFRYSIKQVELLEVDRAVGMHNFTSSPKTLLLYDDLSSISERQHSLAFATVLTAGHLKAQEKQGGVLLKGGDGDGFMLNRTFISVRGPVVRSPQRVSVGVLSNKGSLQTREVPPGQLCLEFVHITKTGGTAIESIAAASGLSWGACKWRGVDLSTCKGVHGVTRSLSGSSPWHNPRTVYDCPNLFTVVRDPYTRMLSAFYCKWAGYKGKEITAEILNTWLQQKLLTNHSRGRLLERQANYIFDEGGLPRIKHVLHYENLEDEFNTLMKHFNMSLRYTKQKINASLMDRKLTISDLTEKTLTVINRVYAKDFTALGYAVKTDVFSV